MKTKHKHYNDYKVKIVKYYDEIEEPKGSFIRQNMFWVVEISTSYGKTSRRCDNKKEIIKFLKEELVLI